MAISSPTNMDYLFPFVRLRIGDTDETAYRYDDDWIRTSLVAAVQKLMTWWNYKYLLENDYDVYRNPNGTFIFPESYGIIQPGDDQIIVLMASYILLSGSLENSAWDFVSWKDAEIAFSNLESSRARNANLKAIWEELTRTLKTPQSRLAQAKKRSLPGYKDNQYEKGSEY